jgi:hypothetical protein
MSRLGVFVIATALVVGCTADSSLPTAPLTVPVVSQSGNGSPNVLSSDSSSTSSPALFGSSANRHFFGGIFGTSLNPREEVAPGVASDSRARGIAIFHLNRAGTEASFLVFVTHISNVTQAHIHRGPVGQSGPIVVWLYPSTSPPAGPPGGGPINGVLSKGTFTAANLMGELTGLPLSALVEDIRNNNAYVNVHTNDGVPPTNTGPGDFPGGEIRGQIDHRGH